ncbi:uncharacterized protein RCO7_07577 [Rhynchosporium graminicola]|uniref:Uncharacterized protein n=1 Tax=Rhynchosporium graminicola TaxID=2792576 RepID=A0A1E1KZV2_9HELO|nr:uncharacterized protein RCO7_07577 [Rhynchosporium commune]
MAPFEQTRKVPKPWDTIDLILAEAQNFGPVRPSNLQETTSYPLHKFFSPECWESVSDEDYNLLLPSMQLASNLIQVGLPYLCSFVPPDRVHSSLNGKSRKGPNDYQVDLKDWDKEDQQNTRDELNTIASYVTWELNDTIATDNKWLGVTRLVTDEKWGPRPWKDLLRDDIIRSDKELAARGVDRRRLRVGIMREYVDALKRYSSTSEEHLRATFLAAITMTHEIGHIVWHQDFRSISYDINGKEPYVEDYSISELGCCFIASIFRGKNPFECGKQIPTDFTRALYWERVPKMSTTELYRTDHSMSIPYMLRILSQESWDQLDPRRPDFVVKATAIFQPEEDVVKVLVSPDSSILGPYEDGERPATANIREWTVTDFNNEQKVVWKTAFADRRTRSDEQFNTLTEAEKKYAMYEISSTNPGVFRNNSSVPRVSAQTNTFTKGVPDDEEVRPIDDGVIPLDLFTSGQTDLKAVKRIQIEYRPKPGDFKARDHHQTRPHDHHHTREDAFDYNTAIPLYEWFDSLEHEDSTYDKDSPRDFLFGGLKEEYKPATILALIANKQPEIIAKTTIKDAHQFCAERHIPFGRALPATYVEQNQRLDLLKDADRALIERMRQFCLKQAVKLFAGNNQALLYIYFAAIKYIDDWTREDLVRKCKAEKLPHNGHLDTLQRRVRDKMAKFLRLFARDHNLEAEEKDFEKVGLIDRVDLVKWTDAQYLDFFRIHNIPTWGNRRIWIERHGAFERELIHGLATRRDIDFDSKGEIQRSIDLVEVYAWDAVLAGSSVLALKGALLAAGHFPSDATLNLYFGNDRQTALEDDKPLAYYKPASWETLSLEITRTSPPDARIANTEPEVIVYKPRIPAGVIIDKSHTVNDDSFGGVGLGHRLGSTGDHPFASKNSDEPAAKRLRIPEDVQRIYDIAHGRARPTVTEHLASIHRNAEELTQILHPSGARDKLRPHLEMLRATSAVEMMDSYQDMMEVRADRQRHVDLQVDPETVLEEDKRKRVALLKELRPDLVVGSDGRLVDKPAEQKKVKVGGFMDDLYLAVKKRQGIL